MNEKLIKDMMTCDGTQGKCESCIFADNPECRNAMAHHGGALIQLQEVVVVNQATTIRGLKTKVAEREARLKAVEEVRNHLNDLLKQLAKDLREDKHCETCAHCKEEGADEVCEKCLLSEGESMWRLADRYFADETDQQTPDESANPEADEVTEIE